MNHGPPPRQSIDVGQGVALSTIPRAGDGSLPMLLVHGLASNARLWDGVAQDVARAGHPTVAVDQRGHGRSLAVQHGFDFDTLASDLRRVLEAHGLGPALVVGQSWGGNVVLELARRHPGVVSGVVLVDGGFLRLQDEFAHWDDAKSALTPPSFVGADLASLRRMMSQRMQDWPEGAVEAQLANFVQRDDGTAMPRLPLSSHLEILHHLWQHDPDQAGAEVEAPVLTIAVEDRRGKRARVDAFAQASGADVRWLEGHHDVHVEQPGRVGTMLVDFAAQVGS